MAQTSGNVSMLCLLLLVLMPLVNARLRGFKAEDSAALEASSQESPATVDCGQQPSDKPEVFRDGFDQLELFQQDVATSAGMQQKSPMEWLAHLKDNKLELFQQEDLATSQGMHPKSPMEWLAHIKDNKTKVSEDETILHNEMVAGQLSKINSGSCVDDSMWRDADGDGCEIYRFAIESGKITQQSACNGGGDDLPRSGLRGSRAKVVADATAKVFCPVTCGMCVPSQPTSYVFAAVEDDGMGVLDDVDFLQVGVSSSKGVAKKSVKSWEEHAHDHMSRITSDQRVLDNETVAFKLSQLQKGEGCVDDAMWRDADGDGCEIYKFAIESGKTTREAACGGGGEIQASRGLRGARVRVVADATARVFCPAACGMC